MRKFKVYERGFTIEGWVIESETMRTAFKQLRETLTELGFSLENQLHFNIKEIK